jgi:hypothetical protein
MLSVGCGAPEIRLLDALAAGIDEAGLKAWVRAEAVLLGGPHTSRSYRYPYALLAWHTEPLGVDIERIEPFDRAFMESICTPPERRLLTENTHPDALLASLWSSKEALAKALGDALRYDPRRLDSPAQWPDGRAGPWGAAELALPAGHSGWLCWRSTLPTCPSTFLQIASFLGAEPCNSAVYAVRYKRKQAPPGEKASLYLSATPHLSDRKETHVRAKQGRRQAAVRRVERPRPGCVR